MNYKEGMAVAIFLALLFSYWIRFHAKFFPTPPNIHRVKQLKYPLFLLMFFFSET